MFTCRQLHDEAEEVLIRTCIFNISLHRSREETRGTMGASHCNTLPSIKLESIGLCNFQDFDWLIDTQNYFGALRYVHTDWNMDDTVEEEILKKSLRELFGRPALELVYDSRLFNEQ